MQPEMLLQAEGQQLANGQRKRIVCPFCNAKHETSFVITKSDIGELFGYCYRASCHRFVGTKTSGTYKASTSSFKPRVFEHEYKRLPSEGRRFLFQKYGIRVQQIDTEQVYWVPFQKRILFHVFDKDGRSYGCKTKALPNANKEYPKWITYFERETSKLHYPRGNVGTKIVVLVEDIISAMRVSQVVDAISILGTHLSMEQIREVKSMYDKAIVALDPDALKTAEKLVDKYKNFFTDGMELRDLSSDPKDIKTNEQLLKELKL
jgi:hypothetical protein